MASIVSPIALVPKSRPRVLVVSKSDLSPELGQTILWRKDVDRVAVPDADAACERARALKPSLVIIDGHEQPADALVQRLRGDDETRCTAIVVVNPGATLAQEDTLRKTGANAVFAGRVDPALWDARLDELLHVPRRRAARIPVTLEVWSHVASEPITSVGLNISAHGLLLESARPLSVGTKVDLQFHLPGHAQPLKVVGEVVRDAGTVDGRPRCGVKFLVLRGDARARIEAFVDEASGRPNMVEPFGGKAAGRAEREGWESELRASEAWKSAILESVLDCIVTLDADGHIVEFNRAAEQTFGWTRAQALGRSAVELLVPAALRQRHREALAALAPAGPEPGQRVETTGLRADGSEFPAELTVTPMQVGRRRLFTAFVRDITQRKQAQQAVRASARQFRALFEGAADAMFVADDEGCTVEANAAACALHGQTRGELLGRNLGEAAGSAALDGVWPGLRQRRRAHGDTTVRRPDGTVRDVEFTVTADFLPGSHLAVLRDVTERRQLEAQLRHSQKMEPLGRLAGGVAHDFNNLLNVITGYGELLRREMPTGSPARQRTDHILKAADRAAGLTRQLLAFSRRQVLQPRAVDLNTVVSDFDKMMSRLIGEHIQLSTRLEPAPWRVQADPGQVEQVLMNLVVNARDAMPGGGCIRIETRNVELDDIQVREHMGGRPGPHVLLQVSDDGLGMDRETQRQIFEPFFTTKPKGQGTGLGLATVYGIVKQSDGSIRVDSQPGRGTTFQVYLPRAEGAFEMAGPGSRSVAAPAGVETILLVEDEDMLREMAREVLEGDGYRVLEAANGEEALRVLREHSGPVHLLVTDVVMPGMGGAELGRRALAARPGVKVLFVSGYAEAGLPKTFAGVPTAFLEKPFTPDALERKARELLDAPGEPEEQAV